MNSQSRLFLPVLVLAFIAMLDTFEAMGQQPVHKSRTDAPPADTGAGVSPSV